MGISVTKGQKISLTKEAGSAGLTKVDVELGWDAATEGKEIDLDAAVILTDANGQVSSDEQFVFFNNKTSKDGSAVHSGDNRTGEGDGADETISIDLTKTTAERIDVLVWSYAEEGETPVSFDQVQNLTAAVRNTADGNELVSYNATDLGTATGNLIARLEKTNDEWNFTAVGEQDNDWVQLVKGYGVNVG